MLLAGLLTVLAFAFIAMKFGWGFVQKLIGHQVLVDVIVTVVFMWMFAITGTISGMMTGITAGLLVSVILYVASKFVPHKKLEKTPEGMRWVTKDGEWLQMAKRGLNA